MERTSGSRSCRYLAGSVLRKLLVGLIAGGIVTAMVVPGCGAPSYRVTLQVSPAGAGTASLVDGGPSYAPGATVNITVDGERCFRFVKWTSSPAVAFDDAHSPTTGFTMPASAVTVTASFAASRVFWLDEILIEREPDGTSAVLRLQAGDFDVYAHTLDSQELFEIVDDDPDLWYKSSICSFNTLHINPYGPTFTDETLNPFYLFDFPEGVRTMNEVLNKFIDREHIAGVIAGGLAWPKFTSQHTQLPDYARYYDGTHIAGKSGIRYLEDEYGYDEVTGLLWLNETMSAIDELVPGDITGDAATGWLYDGEPIELTGLFYTSWDPVRTAIGEYVGEQIERMGFVFTPRYWEGWFGPPPHNDEAEIISGGWNLYTGGWMSSELSRDSGYWYLYFHTDFWHSGIVAYKYLDVPGWFYDAAFDLAFLEFSSLAERDALYEICLPAHMKWGMFYLVDNMEYSPLRTNVDLAAGTEGGIPGSWMWALTAHFRDGAGNPMFGGNLRVAMHDLLVEPWNPVAGSNTVYDMFPVRATGDRGTHPDVRDGLCWPGRIDRAEVTVTAGFPATATHDWVTLDFAGNISAPVDAWRAWDWETQSVITVGDALDAGNEGEPWALDDTLVDCYSVAYYPRDIWGHPLHDGSTLSFADFLYGWILPYDRARGEGVNPMYDPGAASQIASTYETTIGVRFTVNPEDDVGLKVETWSKKVETSPEMDAERMVGTGYPNYAPGNGFWHTIALGIRGERAGSMAFGETKAQGTDLGWTDFLDRDVQLGALAGHLEGIRALDPGDYEDASVPYYEFIDAQYSGAGLGSFADEVGPRMDNLKDWVNEKNHLWVGDGSYYLDDFSFGSSGWIRLRAFDYYPDDPGRWLFLLKDRE